MFRAKRSDTTIRTVEETYRVELNARGDMLLGNLLEERGFESLTQLIDAYHGRLTFHPRKRHLFLSFHAEDRSQVQGFLRHSRRMTRVCSPKVIHQPVPGTAVCRAP